MTPYWILFGVWVIGSVHFARSSQNTNSTRLFVIACVLTAIMIGLRYNVGGDWGTYLNIYNNIYFQPLIPSLELTDPGYALMNWLGAQMDTGVWFPNLVCGSLFIAGIGRLASRQPQPWLAMVVAVPYFIIVVAMGYTRQAAAIGIVCFALADANEKNMVRTVAFIAASALLHKSTILMLPLALGPVALKRVFTALAGAAAFIILFFVLIRSQSDQLITNYTQGNYDSQGAGIRIAMNVFAGAILLLLRNRMDLNDYQKSFWTLTAFLTFLSIVALINLSASAGVDRISLSLIPLQMVSLSRLPQALSKSYKPIIPALFGVVAYCFAIQFVWLNYADNAASWVPYSMVITPLKNS